MISYKTGIRVRYGETDQMGIVYHANYVKYLEVGRIEWLRNLGVSYKEMEENGIILPVVSVQLNFKKSATYDDVIQVITKLRQMPTVKIEFDYEIRGENDMLLADGYTKLAFINASTNRPMRCPKFLLDKLNSQSL